MHKIKSVNEVSGVRYKNEFINSMIENSLQDIAGIKQIKVYKLYNQDNKLNIVLMIDKNINVLNILDNSLERIECLLIDDFRFQGIEIELYVIEK